MTTPKELHMMVGLPYSGKSTRAREISRQYNAPIVSPDAIRLSLTGLRFYAGAEKLVWAFAYYMVKALFLAGHNTVILDSTNITKARRDEWRDPSWRRVFITLHTSKQECIRRAEHEGDNAIIPVIERMAANWEPVAEEEWEPTDAS